MQLPHSKGKNHLDICVYLPPSELYTLGILSGQIKTQIPCRKIWNERTEDVCEYLPHTIITHLGCNIFLYAGFKENVIMTIIVSLITY